jgi:hypothetical protein
MSGLNCAIAALDVLGSVVQAVPAVGNNLKLAIEVTKKACEMIKVRIALSTWYACWTIYAEDEGEPRAVRATRGSCG